MSIQGKLLRQAVRQSGMTQEEFASKIGVSRNYLLTIFDKEIVKEKYLDAAIKILGIKKEVITNGDNVITNKGPIPSNAKIADLEIDKPNMYIVPIKAFGGFAMGYGDQVFLRSLDKEYFSQIKGTCWKFQVDGDSMFETKIIDGEVYKRGYEKMSWVVCTLIQDLTYLNKNKDYVIVLKQHNSIEDGVILKKYKGRDLQFMYVESINPQYKPFKIDLKNLVSIFYVEYQQSNPY